MKKSPSASNFGSMKKEKDIEEYCTKVPEL